MPPHINNSLEISVKQLKNNSTGQQFYQTDSSPLGITNTSSSSIINNNNTTSNINTLVNHQTANIRQPSPPSLQTSISFNFLVNEIEEFISNQNLNTSIEEDEEYKSDSDSNLSMEGLLDNTTSSNHFDQFFQTNTPINNDSNLFVNIKNENYDITNILNGYDQPEFQFEIYPTNTQQQQQQQIYIPIANDNSYTAVQIKKEIEDTNSSFSSTNDGVYINKHVYGQKLKNEKRYGPIVVRPRKNPAPTLRTGRKSKYIELTDEEERKRELRRSRNRQAAEKCKQKRSEIEDKLESDLKVLLNEQTNIQIEKQKLIEKKLYLEKLLKQHIESCAYMPNNNNFQCNKQPTNALYPQVSTSNSYNTSLQQQQQQNIQQIQMNPMNYPVHLTNTTNHSSNNNQNYNYLNMNQLQQYDQQQQVYTQQQNMTNRNQINKINHLMPFSNYDNI